MAFPNASKEAAAAAVTARGAWISAHTDDPDTTGANEASGGGYARVQTTWTAGSSDGIINGSPVSLTLPAGPGYECAGVWTAATGGSFVGPLAFAEGPIGTVSVPFSMLVTPSMRVQDAI